jgi:hypothetical protein
VLVKGDDTKRNLLAGALAAVHHEGKHCQAKHTQKQVWAATAIPGALLATQAVLFYKLVGMFEEQVNRSERFSVGALLLSFGVPFGA